MSYKKMILEYFESNENGTAYDIIAYLKGPRIRSGSNPSNHGRGLRIPTVVQVSSILKMLGARKVDVISSPCLGKSGRITVWSMGEVE